MRSISKGFISLTARTACWTSKRTITGVKHSDQYQHLLRSRRPRKFSANGATGTGGGIDLTSHHQW